jgi:hypothetical protein
VPLDSDPACCLGRVFLVDDYYGAEGCVGASGARPIFTKLMSSKNSKLVELMPQRESKRRVSRGCLIQ